MFRLKWFCLVALPLLLIRPMTAEDGKNFAVGSCKPKLVSFPSISVAVSSVPAGATILVCPGVYPEQVTILQPLTLQGIDSANQDQAIVAVPGTGAAANTTSIFGENVAAQILVQTPGPVNIANLSVDGTGGDTACADGTWLAGIFYTPGSSGSVSRVKVSGQINGACSAGVWSEGTGASQPITVEGSSIHDIDGVGIFVADGGSSPMLLANIKGNDVAVKTGLIGILLDNVNGSASNNNITNATFGIADIGAAVSISSNTIDETEAAVLLQGGGTVSLNRMFDSSVGVFFLADGGIVQNNRITNTTVAAVEMNCAAGIVSRNTINDALVGVSDAPPGVGTSNFFNNTATMRVGCTAAAASALRTSAAPSVDMKGASSLWQWRTPASPNGTLK